jgi:hypothetical protein
MLLLVAVAVNFILFAAKNERVKVIKIDKDFVVRYPRVFFWACVIFFTMVLALALNLAVWPNAPSVNLIMVIALSAIGAPLLLISVVWKIRVLPEYIIYINAIGFKRQIYYKDISRVIATKTRIFMDTTLKKYRFSANVIYREYFLKRLDMNGVDVERY